MDSTVSSASGTGASNLSQCTIVVDERGTKLAYTDSGVPHASPSLYTTVFAIHGMCFNYGIFERVQAVAQDSSSYRFVSISRRNYAGSSPYTDQEVHVINDGTDSEKADFTIARGLEVINFMDRFIRQEHIPSTFTGDPQKGGIALIGWSLGNVISLSAIANMKSAPADVRARLVPNLHTLILHEPSASFFNLPLDARNWTPWHIVDPTIPETCELAAFTEFISGYFKHGDLSTKDPDVLSYIVKGYGLRPPTVYDIGRSGRLEIVDTSDRTQLEIPFQINLAPQHAVLYQYLFSDSVRKDLPNMKSFWFGGEQSGSFGPFSTWVAQNDDKAHGGGFIDAKLIPGINHVSAWDDPKITLDLYNKCVSRRF